METQNVWQTIRNVMNTTLFEINKTPVTLFSLLMFLVIIILFFIFSRILNRILLNRVLSRMHIKDGLRYTLIRFNHYLIVIIGFIVAFQFVGINLSGLAVIFGLLSVGIGFGLQNVTSNFVSGLILLVERPIKIGDRVTIGDTEGDVMEINMRSTTIRTLNNIAYIVPNQEFISSNVVNWSHGDPRIRLDIKVGVSYDSDLDLVIAVLKQVADENPDVLKEPLPRVLLWEFADSAWNMELQIWVKDPFGYRKIKSDINCAIVRHFRKNRIEIAYPQRDLHIRSSNPIPLRQEKE
jgi:small-conductance mechanosensitive channel